MTHLRDRRTADGEAACGVDALSLLRYRSNLPGADQRITTCGGGNTGGKVEVPDPMSGAPVRVLAVKGSGSDLGAIGRRGSPPKRTLLKQPITPALHAEAILWLASDCSGGTTGHVIPVDGGLPDAFLR